MTPIRLAFENVTVDFGATRALDGVDLNFGKGEIVGLLGHNGAGKSTLIGVATGAVSATSGQMLLGGQPFNCDTPRQAAALGITVIHQTPALAGNLSVLDNLFLGGSTTGRRGTDMNAARRTLDEAGGQTIRLDSLVATLALGERQLVALARGLIAGEMKVLFLDEPTAALGQAETDSLHALIRRLASRGTTVIYVSHRLPDIVEVCDRVSILREGCTVGGMPVAGLSTASLAQLLAPELQEIELAPSHPGKAVLTVKHPHPMKFCSGEVVGLFGIAAGAQLAVLQGLHGQGGVEATLGGVPYVPRTPQAAIKHGVHRIVADRDRDGLILGMGALDNVYLPWRGRRHDGRQVAPTVAERSVGYADVRERLSIHGPEPRSPVSAFSGGNRQKHLLASWLYPVAPRVLLLEQPTQGVDVGAKADIRDAVRAIASQGAAVLVASAESDEIASMCDRSYVLSGGGCVELPRTDDFAASLLQTLLDLIPDSETAS